MKALTPGIMSLVVGGYIYVQAYNVAMENLKHMQHAMDAAVVQLAGSSALSTIQPVIPDSGSDTDSSSNSSSTL